MKISDCMKRNVVSIPATLTIAEAASIFVTRKVGLLPIVDEQDKPIGILSLRDLLELELPDFVNFIADVDFVHDFGAVETTRPTPEELAQPVTTIMQPITPKIWNKRGLPVMLATCAVASILYAIAYPLF